MARKRSLDPGIWTSDQFISLTHRQRLMFIGLISNADDEGRLRGESKKIKALIFPGDHMPISWIENDLQFLTFKKLIHRWQIDEEIYIELPTWTKYQKLNFKTDSHLPQFKKGTEELLTKDFVSVSPQLSILSKCINKENKEINIKDEPNGSKLNIEKDGSKDIEQIVAIIGKPFPSKLPYEENNVYDYWVGKFGKTKGIVGVIKLLLKGGQKSQVRDPWTMTRIIDLMDTNLEDPISRFIDMCQKPATYLP